jgi:hypothetical protein
MGMDEQRRLVNCHPWLCNASSMTHQLLFWQQLQKSNQKKAAPRQNSTPKLLALIRSRKQVPYLAALKKHPCFLPG